MRHVSRVFKLTKQSLLHRVQLRTDLVEEGIDGQFESFRQRLGCQLLKVVQMLLVVVELRIEFLLQLRREHRGELQLAIGGSTTAWRAPIRRKYLPIRQELARLFVDGDIRFAALRINLVRNVLRDLHIFCRRSVAGRRYVAPICLPGRTAVIKSAAPATMRRVIRSRTILLVRAEVLDHLHLLIHVAVLLA
jgi:hypothetical protein